MLKKDILQALFLATLVGLCMWLAFSRIGVQDSDAYSYVVGAYSIQEGSGYKDLTGGNLNHWPPGYSFILSFFSDPLRGALIINYISLGLSVGLIYLLAVKSDWNRCIALTFSLVMGFGFLRVLASNAKPDILTYAFFLLGILLYNQMNHHVNIMSYLIWSTLILVKLIAIIFTPAGLFVDWMTKRPLRQKKDYIAVVAIVLIWLSFLGLMAFFNYSRINVIIPASFGYSNLLDFIKELYLFARSIPRSFIFNWYGSIRNPKILIPFLVSLIVSMSCLSTLRIIKKNSKFIKLAVTIIILTISLYLIRKFSLGVRLTGYGLLILFFAFQPLSKTKNRWILYAVFSIVIAFFNTFSVNSLGANDPRYESMVHELAACDIPREPIYTNSFHILDIHARIPSIPVSETDSIEKGAYFLWVDMPSYDGITTTVWPVEKPGRGWRKIVSVENAILFKKE